MSTASAGLGEPTVDLGEIDLPLTGPDWRFLEHVLDAGARGADLLRGMSNTAAKLERRGIVERRRLPGSWFTERWHLTDRGWQRICGHDSAHGVDQADGDDKVWECDACELRYRSVPDPTQPGIHLRVPISA